jgi:ribonuclease-3
LDQGLEAVQRFVEPLIAPAVAEALDGEQYKDPKSQLQELAQSQTQSTPRYSTIAESGPDHAKEFTVQVTIGGVVYGQGSGLSKQRAAQEAARAALAALQAESNEGQGTVV